MRKEIWLEAAAVAGAYAATVALCARTDLFERFYAFTRLHEALELDDLLMALPVLLLGLGWFAIRRVGAQLAESRSRLKAEQALSEARLQLGRAEARQAELLGHVAHEIRSPLAGIVSVLEVLEPEVAASDRELVTLASGSCRRLLALLGGLIRVAKQRSGVLELDPRPFDVASGLRQALELYAPLVRTKGLELSTSVAPEVPAQVCGDEDCVNQILMNLLGNAVKFTEQGGVVVSVRAEPHDSGDPSSSTDAGNLELVYSVQDSGAGFSPEQLERILSGVPQPAEDKRAGGLGLVIVRSLVEMLHGRMAIASRVDEGTTVTVRLPMSRIADSTPAA